MLVLLDTNAYLRLAKRIRPAVGVVFGHKAYVITVHQSVEDEVHRSARLKSLYPWFDGQEFAESWHGYELLNKLRAAKVVDAPLIREIYAALEVNGDLPKSWGDAKHTLFLKIFGRKKC